MLLVLTLIACPGGGTITTTATPTPMPDNHVLCMRTNVYLQHGGARAEVSQGTTRPFSVGDGVGVDTSGRARLRFRNYLVVEVFRDSDLKLESMAAPDAPPAYKFKMRGGTIYAGVNPATEVVSIESDLAVITALGTKFWVYVQPGEITWVLCKEGEVQITAQGRTVTVPANHQSWVLPGQPPHKAVRALRGEVADLLPPLEELTGGEKTDGDVFLPEEIVSRRAATHTPTPTGIRPPTSTPTPTATRRPTSTPTPTSPPPAPLPDLLVADVSLTEDNRIQCLFENLGGEVSEGDVRIAIYVNRMRIAYAGVETPIFSGEARQPRTNPLDLSGEVEVRCVIDADGNIVESDEYNNELRRVFIITPPPEAWPDLIVTDLAVVEQTRIECSYWNVGTAETPAGDLWIEILVDSQPVARANLARSIEANRGGAFTTAPLDISGSFYVTCIIDADDNVQEANENNNVLSAPLQLGMVEVCPYPAADLFAELQQELELGCAQDEAHLLFAAWQPFDMGYMLWREDTRQIYVLVETAYVTPIIPPGSWEAYADRWKDGMPEISCDEAEYQDYPVLRGFGYLWCNEPEVREALGNPVGEERGDQRLLQTFERGWAMHIGEWEDGIVVLTDDKRWVHYPRL